MESVPDSSVDEKILTEFKQQVCVEGNVIISYVIIPMFIIFTVHRFHVNVMCNRLRILMLSGLIFPWKYVIYSLQKFIDRRRRKHPQWLLKK